MGLWWTFRCCEGLPGSIPPGGPLAGPAPGSRPGAAFTAGAVMAAQVSTGKFKFPELTPGPWLGLSPRGAPLPPH